jgi:addiction module HigA family antidote
MIKSFRDRATERLWMGAFVKRFSGIERQALRKLDMLHSARELNDLRAPPANRLETLAGDRRGQHSIPSTTNGASASFGPRRVRPMSKSSITTRGIATPNRVTTHPGEVLDEEFLVPLGISVNALAMALRVPATRIGAIVKGERSVTADTALRLARFFGTSPEFWMNLQAMYDLTKARRDSGGKIRRDVRPRAA